MFQQIMHSVTRLPDLPHYTT